jgi:hypothetical protein
VALVLQLLHPHYILTHPALDIEDEEVIKKILRHLGLWDLKVSPPPKVKAPSVTIPIDDSDSQVSFSASSFYPAPGLLMDSQRIFKPGGVTPLVAISAINPLFLVS